MAWLTAYKPRPCPYVLPCRIRSFYVKGVGINTRELQKLGEGWNSALLGWEAWLIHTPPHVCYHVKFGSSSTNGVRINGREPPKLGSAGGLAALGGAWLTSKNKPLPICVTRNVYMWPRPRSGLDLGLGIGVLASFNIHWVYSCYIEAHHQTKFLRPRPLLRRPRPRPPEVNKDT